MHEPTLESGRLETQNRRSQSKSSQTKGAPKAEPKSVEGSAEYQLGKLQEGISRSLYSTLPYPTGKKAVLLETLEALTNVDFLRQAFVEGNGATSDLMPPDRKKRFHTFGVTTTFKMRPAGKTKNPFTGVLGPLESCGIMRFSNAKGPVTQRQPHVQPGIGIKWLIDQAPSVNILVMCSLIPQQWNTELNAEEKLDFFKFPFSNHPQTPKEDDFPYIAGPFRDAQVSLDNPLFDRPNRLPVEHLATIEPNGSRVQSARSPWQLYLKPSKELLTIVSEIKNSADADSKSKYLRDIRTLLLAAQDRLVGQPIFEVHQRTAAEDQRTILTHEILATQEFQASSFGDERLWFQHHLPQAREAAPRCPVRMPRFRIAGTRLKWLGTAFGIRSKKSPPDPQRPPVPQFENRN